MAAAALLLFSAHAQSQGAKHEKWGPIRPWDQFTSVAVTSAGRWFVVGKNGVLLTSTDGGRTWSRRWLAKRGDLSWFDLYSVRFASDGRNGWISGERGVVLHTSDGGATWTEQKSGVAQRVFRIAVFDAQHAAGAGGSGTILWTDDGGSHWHSQTLEGAVTFFDLAFGDSNNAWAVGEFGTVVHSADGGRTWTLQQGGDRTKFRVPAYLHVMFQDARRGWVAGQGGTVMYTSDGGATWQSVKTPVQVPIYGGTLRNSSSQASVWYVGDEGRLFSIAAPASAAPAESLHPTFASLVDIAFSGQNGIAVGGDGTILRTSDNGKSWQPVEVK